MILYHGTTDRQARRICQEGFLPKKPSRRVWFAESRGYAEGRAKTQARRRRDRAVVLTCDINLPQMRDRLGPRKMFRRNGVIAIDGFVPVTVLRSHPSLEFPSSPEELAAWMNRLLGLKPYKGVGRRHPGIQRLSRWVVNRLADRGHKPFAESELLEMARRWLSDVFEGFEVDPERLRAHRKITTIEVAAEIPAPETDPREEEALDCLLDSRAKRRVRGLEILRDVEVPDLFEWCVMFLDDESVSVRVAALQAMLRCEDAEPEMIELFAGSQEKRIRAAAIAALAKHSGEDAPRWLERGLKDSAPCVRLQTASQLGRLDPVEHRSIFELALYDPNPQIARMAEKLTTGKGFAKPKW